MQTIGCFQTSEYTLIECDGDILELNSEFNTDFDGFVVKIDNGDYEEVYGFYGMIPFNNKQVIKVK